MIFYINTNLEEELHVADIAEYFHYSEKHIYHLFITTLGVTPKQFINNVKLQNVCHFLESTDFSLQDLAEKCGFATTSHLINNFKKEYGMTPAAYRKLHREID